MKTIIREAAEMRKAHFKIGMPMRSIAESFKEANIAHDVSAAFRKKGYYIFPEFPVRSGSIDALFIKNSEVIVCEWKRFHNRNGENIKNQTKRMLEFNPNKELSRHRISIRNPVVYQLWVCDAWYRDDLNWWLGKKSNIKPDCPFDETWEKGVYDFPELDPDWNSYHWLWAYHKNENGG